MRLPEELGGGFFRCDLRDSIAREVCFTGRYEPQETALVRALLGPGMSFVDVGANWGYFTLLAAHQVGRSGRVISLEPDPRLFPVLADNIAVNHLSQVTALQVAAGSESGSLTLAGFDEAGDNFGLSRVVGQHGLVPTL
jgi:tRNA G37 N-methylase Trm5